jgi:hypothetical protein
LVVGDDEGPTLVRVLAVHQELGTKDAQKTAGPTRAVSICELFLP